METAKQRAYRLVTAVQAAKQPLEDKRTALWAELEAALRSIEEREQALRAQIREVQDQVAPLDKLALEAAQAGQLKSEKGATLLLNEIEKRVRAL